MEARLEGRRRAMLAKVSLRAWRTASGVLRGLGKAVGACCVAHTFFTVAGYPACVNGASMKPTLNDLPKEDDLQQADSNGLSSSFSIWWSWAFSSGADWVLVNRWAASRTRPQRGEIVVFVSPKDPDDHVIKRVVGVEHDVVQVGGDHGPVHTVPSGHCWVEGDNLVSSVDSRRYGPVSVGLVFGKVTHVVFPPSRFRRLSMTVQPQQSKVLGGRGGL